MRKVSFALVCLFVLIGSAYGSGIRTTFVKVTLENLKIGDTYNIREMANLPLAVYNTGDEVIDLAVEPTIPIKGELREGYEPVPDASWIVVRQDTFRRVEPGGVAMTDVLISIPDAREYLGKKYQAMVWSHTIGQGMIACGLKGEILFGISTERADRAKTIYLLPTEMYITGIEAGQLADVGQMSGGVTLKVFNPSDEDRQIKIASVRHKDSQVIPQGYLECPDPDFLILSEQKFTLPKLQEKEISLYVAFPKSQEYIGNKYSFVVQGTVSDEAEPRLYSRVYVSLRE